jgi:hypothetical protein
MVNRNADDFYRVIRSLAEQRSELERLRSRVRIAEAGQKARKKIFRAESRVRIFRRVRTHRVTFRWRARPFSLHLSITHRNDDLPIPIEVRPHGVAALAARATDKARLQCPTAGHHPIDHR